MHSDSFSIEEALEPSSWWQYTRASIASHVVCVHIRMTLLLRCSCVTASKSCTRGFKSWKVCNNVSHFCLEQAAGYHYRSLEELTADSADFSSLLPRGQHPSDQEMEDSLERCSCSRELLAGMTLEMYEQLWLEGSKAVLLLVLLLAVVVVLGRGGCCGLEADAQSPAHGWGSDSRWSSWIMRIIWRWIWYVSPMIWSWMLFDQDLRVFMSNCNFSK